MTDLQHIPLTRKDFVSDQDVRWCPGCGDYAILAQVQKLMPELGVPKENIVVISGIGCSSRFPYYVDTYGMHSIHGRAPTIASGLKMANPDLHIFVITGDGDGLSIGGNHLLHILRRNIDVTIILFNNRIYGLTKGQYSPTSLPGTKTKSSPMGSIETSFNPISVAIGAEATFVARTLDTNVKHMAAMLKRAAEHKGTSFVEVLQNCLIFNDGAWDHLKDPAVKDANTLMLEHGEPMLFDKGDKGIRMNGFVPEVVMVENGVSPDELLVHDEKMLNPMLAFTLSRFEHPAFPVPIGVFRDVPGTDYVGEVMGQIHEAQEKQGKGDLMALYTRADTWEVNKSPSLAHMHGGEMPLTQSEGADEYTDTLHQPLPDPSKMEHGLMVDKLGSLAAPNPVAVLPDTSLAEVIETMCKLRFGCMLIADDDGKLIGVFTERDILTRVATQVEDLAAAKVGDYMTRNPRSLHSDSPIAYAVNMMAEHRFRHVPLVDDEQKPVGILSFRDVIRFIEENFE